MNALVSTENINLRPYQQAAFIMLANELLCSGQRIFSAPPGTGKTIVLGEALKRYVGKVAVISRIDVLRDQTMHIFAKLGVGGHVHFYLKRGGLPDLSRFDLIVATECMRDVEISHPNILRVN